MQRIVVSRVRVGSPAHAGIDLENSASMVSIMRFPRTRGDRPKVGVDWFDACWVPPHTRG